MTVSSSVNRKEYVGDGVTLAFATAPVIYYADTDLAVYLVTTATGVSVLQTLNTDYTLAGGSGAVGTVTMVVAPASTETLAIVRSLPYEQQTDFVQNDGSDADVAETANDKAVILSQQLLEAVQRSLRLADSDVSGLDPTLPTPVASQILSIDAAGTAIALLAPASIIASIIPTTYMETLLDDATAAAARTTLGSTAVGDAVFIATTAAAARAALGSTTIGDAMLIAASLAAARAAIGEVIELKSADETVGDTTLQDDDDLSFAIGANEEWVFEIKGSCAIVTADDGIKTSFTVPAGATMERTTTFIAAAAQTIHYDTDASTAHSNASGTVNFSINGHVLSSSTAGTVQLQWAMVSDFGGSTIMRKGATLTAHRIA